MAFLVSPGVQVKEVDLTNVVPAVATSIGAIACPFEKVKFLRSNEYIFRGTVGKDIW